MKRWLIIVVAVVVILNLLACQIETDMDRSWMTATVDAAVVKGDGR